MPLITETYYLSLTQDNRGILRLRCSQDDTLRTVNLKLYNNGSIFVIPSGVSASISGVKQNGAVFSKPCTISQDRESVILQLSSDITNVDGIIVAEIVLNDGEGGRLGTSNFIIQVEKNPIRAGVVQDTETPIEYINDFITQIQALTARLNNLITPNGDASLAEVIDARISSLDGHTYQNLKARIDADIATLNTGKANKSEVYTKSQVDELLENIEIDVDDELSDESENPVQNKVINRKISEIKADLDAVEDTIDNVGMSNTAKAALLECLRHVAYDNNDIDYLGSLERAIYPYAGIIYVTKGLGVSGNAITSNTKRAVTTEIPFSNTAPITIHVILDNEAASEYMWNFRILDAAGSPLTFAEINGTFKFMRDGVWTIGDGGGWYNHSYEMTYVEDTTITTVRCVVSGKSAKNSMILLIAGADQNADIPTTPLSGDIIIQGRRYRLEEAES